MTVADTTARDQTEAIAFEFDLPHAPEKVWRALTDPDLLAEWLLPVTGLASAAARDVGAGRRPQEIRRADPLALPRARLTVSLRGALAPLPGPVLDNQ
jgi:hypothetical protein